MRKDARELCEDMLDALENCELQMTIAGLGYATKSLREQIAWFTDRMDAMNDAVTVSRIEVESRREPIVYEMSDEVGFMLDRMGSIQKGEVKRYAITVTEVG